MTREDFIKAKAIMDTFVEESYDLTEAAELIGVTRQMMWTEYKTGKLNAVKVGPRAIRVSKEDLYRYLWNRTFVRNMFRLLRMNGYGTSTLDEIVNYLDGLES